MRIKLLKMKLENFMTYVEKTFDFSNLTTISGKNGIGKSTIATAFNWCLFNCDYDLKDNPVVRREVDGKSVDDVDVAVELTLDVDGKEVAMRKVQKRTYSKSGDSYKDDNQYFVNEVPMTLKKFNTYIEADMKALLMCSNINAFLNQKPADMRSFLFNTVENITDVDVAKSTPGLEDLVERLEKYSAEEITLMNRKIISDVKSELPVIDGQIKEKERDIQLKSDMDVSDLEIQKNSLKEQVRENVEKQNDSEKAYEAAQLLSDGIMELKFSQSELKRTVNEVVIKRKSEIKDKISEKNFLAKNVQSTIKETEAAIETAKSNIDRYELKLEGIRKEWIEENAREFDEASLICPYCKQEYPRDKQLELAQNFAAEKAELLKSITADGNKTKEHLDVEKGSLIKLTEELEDHKSSLSMLEISKHELEQNLEQAGGEIDITTDPEYQKLQKQIEDKEEALKDMNNVSEYRKTLKEDESELRAQLAECEKKIAFSDTTADEKRLEELKLKKLDMVQKQADAEKILNMIDELNKAKNERLSDAINRNFDVVKWKLWELNKSGSYKNICTPTVDGKSILTIMSNKGNRILGKIDICRGIQKITGIKSPIWVDDCESLDSENQKKVSDMVIGQLIMLVVNDNEKLKVEG